MLKQIKKLSLPVFIMYSICLAFIAVLVSSIAFGQSVQPNVSVDPYTGLGSVVIPLGKVRSTNLSAPVTLIYNASGLDVSDNGGYTEYYPLDINGNELKGWAVNVKGGYSFGNSNARKIASNWIVSVGGIINREVKGLPDDFAGTGDDTRAGWLHSASGQTVNDFIASNYQSNYTILNTLSANKDTEPDIFSYSVGDFSGKLIFDYASTGTIRAIHTIPYKDIDVSYTLSGSSISTFTIKTNTGTIYKFEPTVTVKDSIADENVSYQGVVTPADYLYNTRLLYKKPVEYVQEWGLTSITSAEDNAGITIDYSGIGEADSSTVPFSIIRKTASSSALTSPYSTDFLYERGIIRTKIFPWRVRNSHGSSIDISLQRVAVNTPEYKGTFDFIHEYKERVFLSQIVEHNGCSVISPVKFNYSYIDDVPATSTSLKDLWGKYNALPKPDEVYYPKVYIYPQYAGSERYRFQPIPGNNNYYMLNGDDRSANENGSIGSLRKITLQRGGSIILGYECNEYYDQAAGINIKGPGMRVSKIQYHDGITAANDLVKTYEYAPNSGRILQTPVYAFPVLVFQPITNYTAAGTQDHTRIFPSEKSGAGQWDFFTFRSDENLLTSTLNDNRVGYAGVTERISGQGKTVYEFSVPVTNQSEADEQLAPFNYKATASYISSGSSIDNPMIPQGSTSAFPFAENTNYGFEYGNLLSKKLYDTSGNLISRTDYTYERIYKDASPYIIKGLALQSTLINGNPVYHYGQYAILTDVDKVVMAENTTNYDRTDLSKKLTSANQSFRDGANHSLISRIEITSTDGTIHKTSFKYVYEYPLSTAGTDQVKALYWLKNNNSYALPVETVSSVIKPGQSEKVISSSLNIYKGSTPANQSGYQFCYPYQQWSFSAASPVTDFIPSSVNLSNNSFNYDSRYRINSTNLSWANGQAAEVIDSRKNIQSVLMKSPLLKQADISNARLNEAAFDHADNLVNNFNTTAIFHKTGVVKSALTSEYIFSCRLAAGEAGTLTVTLQDTNGHTSVKTLNYSYSPSIFKLYTCIIPVSNLEAAFNVTVTASSVVGVESCMLFYPAQSTVSYYKYDAQDRVISQTTNGKIVKYEYDDLGRPILVRDGENNILQFQSYGDIQALYAYFQVSGNKWSGETINFTSIPALSCDPYSNATHYQWDYGDGASGTGMNASHVYEHGGMYAVTLTVSHTGYKTAVYSQNILIRRDITYTACTSGPVTYNAAQQYSDYSQYFCGEEPEPPGTNTFQVSVAGDIPSTATLSYQWYRAYQSSPEIWTQIPYALNSFHQQVEEPLAGNSYIIRCEITVSNTDYLFGDNQGIYHNTLPRTYITQIPITFY